LAGAEENGERKECQAQYDDRRAAGRYVPAKSDGADGGTRHDQYDGCEREDRKPAMLCPRSVC
jgi:hypothetical protein